MVLARDILDLELLIVQPLVYPSSGNLVWSDSPMLNLTQRARPSASILGRDWYDVSSGLCLAGLIVLLHEIKFILFYSRVLRGV